MRIYLKGDYTKTDFYDEFKEIAQKMWFKERKGIPLDFSYAWDEYLHLNLRLDKLKHNDERWESANFNKNINADNPCIVLNYEKYNPDNGETVLADAIIQLDGYTRTEDYISDIDYY